MAEVVLSEVAKNFGDTVVLQPTDLHVADGEFLVLVGPSGSGKSTLLRLIAGLEEVGSGRITIGQTDVTDASPSNRGIAMVFQSYALYPHLTVFENLAFALRLAKLGKEEIDRRVREAAEILAITDLLERKPKQLSGGQRQRVAIGRAIVREPAVFLFDEPLSNLDAALRVSMRYEFARLHRQLGTTMIYVTHDQVEAMTLADRIVVLANGRIEQIGSPLELYEHPANLFVAGFIGSPKINLLPAEVMEASAERVVVKLTDGSRFTGLVNAAGAEVGDLVTLGLRPEQFAVADGDNSIAVVVRFVEELGGVTFAYVDHGETKLTVQLPGGTHVAMDDRIRLRADAGAAYLFGAEGCAFTRLTTARAARTASGAA